jgi:CRISPR-associated endonuclease Cas3-HD
VEQSSIYLAHSANGYGKGVPEPLHEHLKAVSDRASIFASAFGAEEQAFAAGLLHDLGKYSEQFLRRLKNPRREKSRDHWTAGAALLSAPPLQHASSAKYRLIPAFVMKGCRKNMHVG